MSRTADDVLEGQVSDFAAGENTMLEQVPGDTRRLKGGTEHSYKQRAH